MDNHLPKSIVIFGASGDLTRRKLIPSLFNLCRKGRLSEPYRIIGSGGTAFTDEQFQAHLLEGVKEFANFEFKEDEWVAFTKHLFYVQANYNVPADFKKLEDRLAELEGGPANRLYYMAIPPELFPVVVENLDRTGQLQESEAWRRVVFEKPFGTDLASAQRLNQQIHTSLKEDQIFRIDHYLGKETVQNILFTRFANTIFEPIWNRNYVDHVEITVAEEVGVEHRGRFYDSVGVLRDVFQNHLLQLLCLTAMEPPASFSATHLRNEKVKVLSAIQPMTPEQVARGTVRGQYAGYRQEPDVNPDSTTATFAALRLFVNNWRWQGVPFYLRSGKKLASKSSLLIIQFKEPPLAMFPMQDMTPNMLVLFLQPDEGVHLRFEAKAPDTVAETRSVDMEFRYSEAFGSSAIPEAYERLLLDAVQGDAALFTRADEVETAWSIIDPIIQAWKSHNAPRLATYQPGTWGPSEADALLARDGCRWMQDEARVMLTT
jgi:glucose-6-phosphate 1-dehydrogenase